MFPTSVQGLAGRLRAVAHHTLQPGTARMFLAAVPLYLLGHKMTHCYPYVPVGGEMAVNCAILSYNGMALLRLQRGCTQRRLYGVWRS